jgi:hypothetical protein
MANITITFADGTSHVYENVPGDVTRERALQRARQDFPGREVSGVSGGTTVEATQQAAMPRQFGTTEKAQMSEFLPRTAISEPSLAAPPSVAFEAGVPTDQARAIQIFAQRRGIDPSRYRVINGEIAFRGDDGQFYKEVAGPKSTAAFYTPDVLAAIPEIAVGGLTAPMMVSGPLGVAASAGLTGLTAGAVEAGRQAISGQEMNLPRVGTAAGLSGLLQAVIPGGAKAMTERRLVRDVATLDTQRVKDILSKAQQQGVQLTPAEITNLSSLMAQQKVIGNIPASTKTMQDFYETREFQQLQPAVDKFLSQISPVSDVAEAGLKGQDALISRREALDAAREAATQPTLDRAFELSVPIDISPVARQVDRLLKNAAGKERDFLLSIKKDLYTEKPRLDAAGNEVTETVLKNSLPALQRVKFALDSRFKDETFTTLDNVVQADLKQIKDNLVTQMGKDNPEYLAYNKLYELESRPINEFDKSKAGLSLTALSRDNLNQFAGRLFESNSVSAIKYAKDQIEKADPEAWGAVSRAYLQQIWEKAKTPAPGQRGVKTDTGNTWQNLLLGDAARQRAVATALGPQQFQALRDLADVLQAAARVPKLGSDTAFNQEILRQMKAEAKGDPVAMLAGATGTLLQPQNWGKMVSDWAVERRFANDAEKLAKIITDPDGINKLRQLRQMSPTDARRWAGLAQLLNAYGILEVKE